MAERNSTLTSDVVYEYAYKSVKCGPHAGRLSAVLVTSSGDVYGAGTNTLVRCYMYHDEYPMQEGGGPVIDRWMKIDQLSGLGIRKIIVGEGYGAAVTNKNELLTWGKGLITFLGKQAIIMFEVNGFGTTCSLCITPHNYDLHFIGRLPFNYCQFTHAYPVYTEKYPPPDGVQVRRFLCTRGDTSINCPKCTKAMTSMSVNSIPLAHCPFCNRLWDVDENVGFFGNREGTMPTFRLGGIKDIASQGKGGIWLLKLGNEIEWKSFEKLPGWTGLPVENSENVKISAVCGAQLHTVVRTTTGGLCRVLLDRQLDGRKFILEDIPIQGKAVKICCGLQAIACLLEDKSIWVLFDGHPPKRLLTFDKKGTFMDIAAAHWCDTFYVQATRRTVESTRRIMEPPESGSKILFKVDEADCRAALLDAVCSQSIPISSAIPQSPASVFGYASVTLPPFLVSLYSKDQLSDLTLKLANDEDFPAHRSVLMSTSTYFKKMLLSNTEPHVTLDMSSYNPKAYKSLLKYYYQHEPDSLDNLDMDGLLDLYLIADSYEEAEISSAVEGNLKVRIDTENVLNVYGMSQLLNIEKIKTYCEHLIRSSNFKEKLLDKALRDPVLFLVLLE